MSTLYEQRVKRLREHVLAHQKKDEKLIELTKDQIMAALDEKGIEYNKKDNKATLTALLEEAQKETGENPEDDEGAE